VAAARLERHGVTVPHSVALPHSAFRELGAAAVLDAFVASIGLPLVVKPTKGGSALGVTVVRDAGALPAAMVSAFAYGDTVMIEEYVPGAEIAVCVLDGADSPVALPVVEIRPDREFYDYDARYTAGSTEFFVPARISATSLAAAESMAIAAHRELALRHWSRADLIVRPDGSVVLLEVCVAPGMTETSLYPQAISAAGLDLGVVVAGLVAQAMG
jgi:D-alanine-D-alanine ligase